MVIPIKSRSPKIAKNHDSQSNDRRSSIPWLCWLGFYQRPSIHNDDYCNFIHVEASYMMITVIWSMSKHPWWWLLQFNPCPSILDDLDWDFINVQAYLMMMGVWSMYKYPCWWSSGFNPCLKTNFLSSWQKFGHDDNSNCHRDKNLVTMTGIVIVTKFFVMMTKIWSHDNSNCHRDQFFVSVTKIWLRWQFQLSSWPNFMTPLPWTPKMEYMMVKGGLFV